MDLEKPSKFQEKHIISMPVASNLLFELSVDSSLKEALVKPQEEQMSQKKRSLTHGQMNYCRVSYCLWFGLVPGHDLSHFLQM